MPTKFSYSHQNKFATDLDLSSLIKFSLAMLHFDSLHLFIVENKKEPSSLELLVDRLVPSTNVGLLQQRIDDISKAMTDLRSKIAEEPNMVCIYQTHYLTESV